MKVIVTTTPLTDGRILQEIHTEVDGQIQEIMRYVYDTKEEQVKEALIKLGWTPPVCLDHCSIGHGSVCCQRCEYYKGD